MFAKRTFNALYILLIIALIGASVMLVYFLPWTQARLKFTEERVAVTVGLLQILTVALLLGHSHVWRWVQDVLASVREPLAHLWRGIRCTPVWMLLVLAGFTLIGAVLRLRFLDQPIRLDEAITYLEFARNPIYVGVTQYSQPNNHVLHTILVHIATRFGSDVSIIRIPAFIAGILSIPATFLLGTMLYNYSVGILAVGFITFASYFVELGSLARGYTLQAVLLLIGFVCLSYILLKRREKPTNLTAVWLLFTGCSALGFYTVPTMLYGFGVMVVWAGTALLMNRDWKGIRDLIVACTGVVILTGVLYVPIFLGSGLALINNEWVQPISRSEVPNRLGELAESIRYFLGRDTPAAMTNLLWIGVIGGILLHVRIARHRSIPLTLIGLLVCTAAMFLQSAVPPPRVFVYLMPFVGIVSASGLIALIGLVLRPQIHQQVAAAGIAVLFSVILGTRVWNSGQILQSRESGTVPDLDLSVNYIIQNYQPGDAVATPWFFALQYHLQQKNTTIDPFTIRYWGFSSENRIFIIQLQYYFTLDRVMNQLASETDFSQFTTPKLIEEFSETRIYVLYRRDKMF
jgi:hypothetical protein